MEAQYTFVREDNLHSTLLLVRCHRHTVNFDHASVLVDRVSVPGLLQ